MPLGKAAVYIVSTLPSQTAWLPTASDADTGNSFDWALYPGESAYRVPAG